MLEVVDNVGDAVVVDTVGDIVGSAVGALVVDAICNVVNKQKNFKITGE